MRKTSRILKIMLPIALAIRIAGCPIPMPPSIQDVYTVTQPPRGQTTTTTYSPPVDTTPPRIICGGGPGIRVYDPEGNLLPECP
ncbi:MAG: hypothetical protein KJ718_06405 [Nanoarchaeota archaeon]|nr:hypothetical protein [Nanoarchaeota archaeon]MBU1052149.1 hypothetical protein [Nanoarchaeota archaeon]